MLIVVEGLDGAGKSTLVEALAPALRERGRDVEVLREPGGVELSERIRVLVKDPALTVGARAEALLFAAARAQMVEERVRPLLDAGRDVLLDRFTYSSMAYQGGGRELGVGAVAAINAFATRTLYADMTLYLRIDPQLRRERLAGRGESADRLEQMDEGFFGRVAAAYESLVAYDQPVHARFIDAGQPPADVLADALRALGYEA